MTRPLQQGGPELDPGIILQQSQGGSAFPLSAEAQVATDFAHVFPLNPVKHGRLADLIENEHGELQKKVYTCPDQPVTVALLTAHLRAHSAPLLGIGYLAGGEAGTDVGTIDLDKKQFPGKKMDSTREALTKKCDELGIRYYWERSSRGGWHLWIFCTKCLPYGTVKAALQEILRRAGLPESTEVYPRGDNAASAWLLMPYAGALLDPKGLGRTWLEDNAGQAIPVSELAERIERTPAEVIFNLAAWATCEEPPQAPALASQGLDVLLRALRSMQPPNRHDAISAALNSAHRMNALDRVAEELKSPEIFNVWCPDGSRSPQEWAREVDRWKEQVRSNKSVKTRGLNYLREVGFDIPPLEEVSPPEAPWPTELGDLPPITPPAHVLAPELVPAPLLPWLQDVAERTCIPLDYVAVPAIVALSGVIGRQVGMRPKRHDDWTVIVNTWGGIIGPPGVMKSPAINEGLRPLHQLAVQAREAFEREAREQETAREVIEAEIDSIKGKLRKGGDVDLLREALSAKKAELDKLHVKERRYITNDATVEKLGELLAENPRGLVLVRDELAGWLQSMDRTGREGDREFYLETWNGNGSYRVDRIGRGSIPIEGLCTSVVGSIQPGKLRAYIREAMSGGDGSDGLLQRLQIVVWPDHMGSWRNVDRAPNLQARQQVQRVFEYLDRLNPALLGADGAEGEVPGLRFASDAQELFDTWRDELEQRLRSDEMDGREAFASHLSKYRSLMPSLALIFHLVEVAAGLATGKVSLGAAQRAAAWCEYLESHARKVYAFAEPGAAAHALAAKIKAGDVCDGVPVREIYRRHWEGLSSQTAVLAAVEVLSEAGWTRLETQKTGGRPTQILKLHPNLRGQA